MIYSLLSSSGNLKKHRALKLKFLNFTVGLLPSANILQTANLSSPIVNEINIYYDNIIMIVYLLNN